VLLHLGLWVARFFHEKLHAARAVTLEGAEVLGAGGKAISLVLIPVQNRLRSRALLISLLVQVTSSRRVRGGSLAQAKSNCAVVNL
ncbi:MAG: hypothetical protein EBT08_14690, partial [Betaproteobacteria bacterium]|nr:hypothetical protein [Betaproteobacteria bacterium]